MSDINEGSKPPGIPTSKFIKKDLLSSDYFTKFYDAAPLQHKTFKKEGLETIATSILSSSFIKTKPSKLILSHTPLKPKTTPSLQQVSKTEQAENEKIIAYCKKIADKVDNLRRSKGILDPEYRKHRDQLIEMGINDKSPFVRKYAVQRIIALGSENSDPEITKVLSSMVKRMAKQEVNESLKIGPEQALLLRTLFSLNTPDSNRLLCQLLEVENLDPRIKKLALSALQHHHFFRFASSRHVDSLLQMESRSIRWDDFSPIIQIAALPSRLLREQVMRAVDETFSQYAKTHEGIANLNRQYPAIPPQAFLQVSSLSQTQNIPLERFNELFGATKSSHVIEELTFIFTSFLVADKGYSFDVIGKPDRAGALLRALIGGRSLRKNDLPTIVRSLKKGLFLINQTDKEPERYLAIVRRLFGYDDRYQVIKDKIDAVLKKSPSKSSLINQWQVLESMRALGETTSPLSLQVIDRILTHEIIDQFVKLFPGHSINPKSLENLINSWENLDPLFLYAARLNASGSKKTLDLLGEMVTHMDPPAMVEWKKWRYDKDNDVANAQIGHLSESSREAYKRDCFIELHDIVIGTNLEEKPAEIRRIIAHAFLGHHEENSPQPRATNWLRSFFTRIRFDDSNFQSQAQYEISRFSDDLNLLQQIATLRSFSAISSRATDTLERWKKTELEKQARLKKMGYASLTAAEEIEAEISRIRSKDLPLALEKKVEELAKQGLLSEYQKLKQRSAYLANKGASLSKTELDRLITIRNELQTQIGENYEQVIESYRIVGGLAGCSPKPLDNKLRAYLEKYRLDPFTVQAHQLEDIRQQIQTELSLLESSEKYVDLRQRFNLPQLAIDRDIYQAIEDCTVAITVLQLSTLTPRLIGYGILSDDHQKEVNSLASAIERVSKYFKNSTVIIEIDRIKDITGSLSVPAEETDLIFVFTDNPLVSLTIGRYPNGAQSCQKYWDANETLAAYLSDSMTKVCLLIDKNKLPQNIVSQLENAETESEKLNIFNRYTNLFLESIVARRVTKIVRDSERKTPLIFLEPVYTPYDRTYMTKVLNSCARSVLKKHTGLELRRGGGQTNVDVPASSNTVQYEDGECGGPDNGGLGSKKGGYSMPAQELIDSDFMHF